MLRSVQIVLFLMTLLSNQTLSAASIAPLKPGSTVAILPLGGDVEEKEARETSLRVVKEAFRSMRYLPFGPEQTTEELRLMGENSCSVLRTCDQKRVLTVLGVDAVVSVALWKEEGESTPYQVVVRLTRLENWGMGEVRVMNGDLPTALSRAVDRALEESQIRHQVRLRIESEQKNTRIQVDHRLMGIAPVEVEVLPGKHVITATAKGYQTESQFVQVPAWTEKPFVYRIALTFLAGESAPAGHLCTDCTDNLQKRDLDPPTNVWNYLIASGLFTASAALLIPSLYTAIRQNDCLESDGNGRCERYYFGTQSTLMLIAGLASLGGGLAVTIIEPFEGKESIRLTAQPAAVYLDGRF